MVNPKLIGREKSIPFSMVMPISVYNRTEEEAHTEGVSMASVIVEALREKLNISSDTKVLPEKVQESADKSSL